MSALAHDSDDGNDADDRFGLLSLSKPSCLQKSHGNIISFLHCLHLFLIAVLTTVFFHIPENSYINMTCIYFYIFNRNFYDFLKMFRIAIIPFLFSITLCLQMLLNRRLKLIVNSFLSYFPHFFLPSTCTHLAPVFFYL